MASLPLACILTPSPKTNSLLSTSTPKLGPKTSFSPFPCKLQTSHIPSNKSFHHYAITPSTTDVLTSSNDQITLTDEQFAAEREIISNQIQDVLDRLQQLSPEDVKNGNNKPLEDILNDFYSLVGTRVVKLAPNNVIPTPPNIERTMMDLGGKFQGLATSNDGLEQIDPIPFPGTLSNRIDQLVQKVSQLTYFDTLTENPSYYLTTGNFVPIRQENPPTTKLEITYGEIPASINGIMLRNGPDPKFDPEVAYSWLDGDSMIHGIRFKDGTPTYVSRYVGTSRQIQEGDFDRAEIIKYGDMEGKYGEFAIFIQWLRYSLQILDMSYGYTMSNDGMVYHSGRIMALCDFGLPHAISVDNDTGDIKTIGMNDYNGALNHWFAPHPKKDPITGEMFGFGSMYTEPYCIYNYISKDGVMSSPVPITVSDPTYMHDLGMTTNNVVIMDLPYVFSPQRMAEKNFWVYTLDAKKTPRFGVLPRYATNEDEMKWFTFDKELFFIYHNANAWEDGNGNIVLYSCLMNPLVDPKTGEFYIAPATSRRRVTFELDLTFAQMYKFTFNMNTMEATREMVTDTYVDYPKINESYMGRQCQYVYASEINQDSKIPSIRKYDLNATDGNIETVLTFGDGIYGNEVAFVPNPDSPTSEDDGYLITFVHDENTNVSYAYVIDAQIMEITTKIKLPNRVPYGFHTIFVTEDELQAQLTNST